MSLKQTFILKEPCEMSHHLTEVNRQEMIGWIQDDHYMQFESEKYQWIIPLFIQRELVSSCVQSPACCRPETSSAVWPSGCSSAPSTSVTPLLPCTPQSRESSLLLVIIYLCVGLCFFSFLILVQMVSTETAVTSFSATFPCWQIENSPSSPR